MKANFKILLLVTTFFTFSNLFSQQIIVMQKDTVASISVEGIVKDGMNQQIGEISSSGEVRNSQGEIIGSIDGNKFKNADGTILGEKKNVGNEVQIIMPGELVFATVQSGNKIAEINGSIIMSSTGSVTELQLITYFFFF